MEFFEGFKWAVPKAFTDSLSVCEFVEGDVFYDTKEAYEHDWSESIKKIKHSIQVIYPKRRALSLSAATENGEEEILDEEQDDNRRALIFQRGWDSEIILNLYEGATTIHTKSPIRTTQGALYYLLWTGNFDYILSNTPLIRPLLLRDAKKLLHKTIGTARDIGRDRFTSFIMAFDKVNPSSQRNFLNLSAKLRTTYIKQMTPAEAGIDDRYILPTIDIVFFSTDQRFSRDLEHNVQKALRREKAEKFVLSFYGAIYPKQTLIEMIYKNSDGVISAKRVIHLATKHGLMSAICLETGRYKSYRKDRVLEYLDDFSHAEKRLKHYKSITADLFDQTSIKKEVETEGLTIHFVGFRGKISSELRKLAQDHGITIKTSPSKQVDFLCCGDGFTNRQRHIATKIDAVLISESQFRLLLKTGEMPEDTGITKKLDNVEFQSLSVCFTGFKKAVAKELIDIAISNGIRHQKSVGSALSMLVIGANAGPKKIEKAKELGIKLVPEELFRQMIKSSELTL